MTDIYIYIVCISARHDVFATKLISFLYKIIDHFSLHLLVEPSLQIFVEKEANKQANHLTRAYLKSRKGKEGEGVGCQTPAVPSIGQNVQSQRHSLYADFL